MRVGFPTLYLEVGLPVLQGGIADDQPKPRQNFNVLENCPILQDATAGDEFTKTSRVRNSKLRANGKDRLGFSAK